MNHDQDRKAWDDEYSRRGQLWGGGVHAIPPLPSGTHVLELGCGNGRTAATLLERGFMVTALDFSHHAILLARKNTRHLAGGEFLVADARYLPFGSSSHGTVLAWHVTGHLAEPDRYRTAEEIIRILRPGGTVMVREFSNQDFRCGKGSETEPGTYQRGNGIRTHYFTLGEILDLFSPLEPVSNTLHCWNLSVRSRTFERAELEVLFRKRSD